jgi:hypothetical protein
MMKQKIFKFLFNYKKMAKETNLILLLLVLVVSILVIGAGCQTAQQGTGNNQGQQGQENQGQEPEPQLLFADDFSGYGTGATPTRWTAVTKDNTYASTKGTTQPNGQYGMVLEIKGKFLKTGDANWKDYTITTDYKIYNAGDHVGPEVIFRLQDNDNYYVLSTNTQPTGTNYVLYKVTSQNTYELKRRSSDKRIDDDAWHSLQISIQGNQFIVTADDVSVMEATIDDIPATGMIGLSSNKFSDIYFDDFQVMGTTA